MQKDLAKFFEVCESSTVIPKRAGHTKNSLEQKKPVNKMAKTKQAKIAEGQSLTFTGYDGDAEGGVLAKGEVVEVTSVFQDDGVDGYNVKNADGKEDTLYQGEFSLELPKGKAKTKVAKTTKAKSTAKAKSTKVEAEAEEAKSKAKTKTTKAKSTAKDESKSKTSRTKDEVKSTAKPKVVSKDDQQLAEVLPKYKKTASVTAILKEHDGDALAACSSLAEREAKTEFTLGGILAFVKRNDLQTGTLDGEGNPVYEEGLKGFATWAYDTHGLHQRKVHSLVSIYEKFSQITTEGAIAKIGWTKLRELLPLELDKENVSDWLKKAKDEKTKELHESVRSAMVDSGEETHGNKQKAKLTEYKFIAHEDQAALWSECIDEAKNTIGDDHSDSEALNHIFTEWLALRSE